MHKILDKPQENRFWGCGRNLPGRGYGLLANCCRKGM